MTQHQREHALNASESKIIDLGSHNALKNDNARKGRLNQSSAMWAQFCALHSIAPKYARAHIDLIDIPAASIGSYKSKALQIIDRPESLLLMGKAGRGKTYFMHALMRALFELKGLALHHLRFLRSVDLDRQLLESMDRYRDTSYLIHTLSDVPFLFIDDFGLERATNKAERDYYDLIDRRTSHERVTVYSTNLTEEKIKSIFGERIDSRLKECAVIHFDGPDLRQGGRL